MINLQSSAIVRSLSFRPCHSPSPWGEGRGEGELNFRERSERHFLCCSFMGELCSRGRQPALIKVSRAYSRAVLKSFSVPRHAWPVAKYEFAALVRKILKPVQACAKLCKAVQAPGEGGGSVVVPQSLRHARTRLVPAKLNLGYFNQIKVILGKFSLFQEKKDCLFFYLAGGWFRSILLLKEKNGDTPNLIL
jgi:hypothetical protein